MNRSTSELLPTPPTVQDSVRATAAATMVIMSQCEEIDRRRLNDMVRDQSSLVIGADNVFVVVGVSGGR